MTTYEIYKNALDEEMIRRNNDDGTVSWIPMDEANSDYQAYLNKDKPQLEHLTSPLANPTA